MTLVSIAERLGGDSFLARALHREHVHVPGSPVDTAGLLTWDDLNDILALHRLEPPRLRLAVDGSHLHRHDYTTPEVTRRLTVVHRLQPGALHERLAEGATLVLDAVDELHTPLADFATALERFVRTGVQINAYASFTPTQGFGLHWDDHDTVVAQLAGSKRWRLYGSTRAAPLHRDAALAPLPNREPIADLVLKPGDLLYVPRGWWHEVTADQGEPSLHVTAGLQTRTGADLVAWVVDRLRRDPGFRSDVPVHDTPVARAAYADHLRALLTAELADPALVDVFAASRDGVDAGRMRPSLPHIDGVPVDGSLTARLTTARAHLATDPATGTTTLIAGGSAFDFAPVAEPLLRPLVEGHSATLAELAARAGLGVADVAAVLTLLVAGQVATLTGGRP